MDVASPSNVRRPPIMQEDEAFSAVAIGKLCAHPRFPDALRRVLSGSVRYFHGNRILNQIGYDRGRLVISILAYYLHVSRRPDDPSSGLTANGIKSLCIEQDVCSPGRARALLSLMRLFGYIATAPSAADRRLKLLMPTDLLVASLRERWDLLFESIALVLPETAAARAALDGPDFLPAFVRHIVDQYRTGVRPLDFAAPLRPFAERNAGLIILFSLAIAGEPDDTVPPMRPVQISISDLARRFGVSRAHVLRLLRDGAAEGFITRAATDKDAKVTFQPALAHAIHVWIATVFLLFAHCSRAALAEIDRAGHNA